MNWHSLYRRKVTLNLKSEDPPARIKWANVSVQRLFDFISCICFFILWSFVTVCYILKKAFATIRAFSYIFKKIVNEDALIAPLSVYMCIVFLKQFYLVGNYSSII
jgi:hypothetical protein